MTIHADQFVALHDGEKICIGHSERTFDRYAEEMDARYGKGGWAFTYGEDGFELGLTLEGFQRLRVDAEAAT